MRPHRRIASRNAVLLREIRQPLLAQIHCPQQLGILRPNGIHHPRQAGANLTPRLRARRSARFHLPAPRFQRPVLRSPPPIPVDHRIAQHAIKPAHHRFLRLQLPFMLQSTHIGRLQNILSRRGIRNTPLHETKKLAPMLKQTRQRCVCHKLNKSRGCKTSPTRGLRLVAFQAVADRAAAVIAARAIRALHRILHGSSPLERRHGIRPKDAGTTATLHLVPLPLRQTRQRSQLPQVFPERLRRRPPQHRPARSQRFA